MKGKQENLMNVLLETAYVSVPMKTTKEEGEKKWIKLKFKCQIDLAHVTFIYTFYLKRLFEFVLPRIERLRI